MPKDEKLQEKMFKRFKSGEVHALYDLLESERPQLYDYLMRMTSQISRSSEGINEIYEALTEGVLDTVRHAHELRLVLYTTARRFNSDIWHADTSRLTNAAIGVPASDGKPKPDEAKPSRTAPLLDKALRTLPGPEREVVWLHIIGGFSLEDVAQAVGSADHDVESLYLRGLGTLDAEVGEVCGPPQTSLLQLPPHPLPPASSNATVNLSMVMAGLKVKPTGIRSLGRMVLLALLVAAAVAAYMTPAPVLKTLVATYLPFLSKL